MIVIVEYNGAGADGIMGLVLDKEGNTRTWENRKSATKWADKNCAFNYHIVNLAGDDNDGSLCEMCSEEIEGDAVVICHDCAVEHKIIDKY